MSRMFLFFSHALTEEQQTDAMRHWGIETFIPLPQDLQQCWSNIDPYAMTIKPQLKGLMTYILENGTKDDIFLVQGETGAVFALVNFIKSLGLRSCYSTTTRIYRKEPLPDGSIENSHIFRHLLFREYEYLGYRVGSSDHYM